MTERNLVLIVGAGASYEFDFPLGSTLVNQIISNIGYNNNYTPANGEGKYLDLVNQFFRYANKEPDENYFNEVINQFKNDLSNWSQGKGGLDAFLITNNNNEYLRFGKFAIAYYIIGSEEWAMRENLYALKKNWLKVFLEKHLINFIDEILGNKLKLTIITFNYDRLIEHFTYSFLRHWPTIEMQGLNPETGNDQSKEFLEKLNIIHVYEKIAQLDWENKDSIAIRFGERNDNKGHLAIASDRVKLIAQADIGRLSEEKKAQIRGCVQDAHKIFFLGFGFDEDNMKILFGNDHFNNKLHSNTSCVATSYKLNEDIQHKYQFIKYYDKVSHALVDDETLFSLKDF